MQDTVSHAVQVSVFGSSDRAPYLDPEFSPTVVHSQQHPELMVHVVYKPTAYTDQSDSIDPTYTSPRGGRRSRLIPVKTAVIEAGPDGHMLVPDLDTMLDYELYHVTRADDGSLSADQISIWDMRTGKRVSDNGCGTTRSCTSADAAGLPILAGLVRFEEVQYAIEHNRPDIGHALRFTTKFSRQGRGGHNGWFIPPATHAAGNQFGVPFVMGMRMRIPASLPMPTGLGAVDRVIWRTLVKYGQFDADNGGTGFITGDADPRWKGVHDFRVNGANLLLKQLETVNSGCWLTNDGANDTTGLLGRCAP